MYNIKEIRKNLENYKKKITERNSSVNFDELIKLDEENRNLIQKKEKKEQEKKLLSKTKDPSNFQISATVQFHTLCCPMQLMVVIFLDIHFYLYAYPAYS